MSFSERLDRDLITDVAGLTRAEEDELLFWARSRVPKIPWETIRGIVTGAAFTFKQKPQLLSSRRPTPWISLLSSLRALFQHLPVPIPQRVAKMSFLRAIT